MENGNTSLSRNTLTFLGLAREYCEAIGNAPQTERADFVSAMVRLLPRLYITMTDHKIVQEPEMGVVGMFVDEDHYNQVRSTLATLMGEEDTYLETFEEDMKYSDTPIAASVSEALADIYQDMYNFVMTVKESEGAVAPQAMDELHENFILYWSRSLCNVMRPLNNMMNAL